MVQTSTGQWADKHGDATSRLWDSDMTPNTIDWTAADGTEYTSKIVYMAVTY